MDATARIDTVSLLADPVRRSLYEHIARQSEAITRDEAAQATGLSRGLAAYHLDKLADAGLLEVTFARVNGRTGPGAGRPAKRYRRSAHEIEITLPPRRYSLLARIIAAAAADAATPQFRAALADAAHREGQALGEEVPDVASALVAAGYEPAAAPGGEIVLRNCPFHAIVQEHTELACGLNHAFVRGTLCGAGCDPGRAQLEPGAGRCCVVIHAEEGTDAPPEPAAQG